MSTTENVIGELDSTVRDGDTIQAPKKSATQYMAELSEPCPGSATPYSVLRHIDAVIAVQGRDDAIRSLHIIRTRIAALVEAARVFDFAVHPDAEDIDMHCLPFTNANLRALSAALKGFGNG